MLSKIQRFVRLGNQERNLFIRALLITGFTSVIITIFPMRWFIKRIGVQGEESRILIPIEKYDEVLLVEKSLRRALRYLPWRPKCFSKAITAKRLLNETGVPSTLYLGVKKDEASKMIAHAWLRCGTIIITGKEEMSKFTPIVFFT